MLRSGFAQVLTAARLLANNASGVDESIEPFDAGHPSGHVTRGRADFPYPLEIAKVPKVHSQQEHDEKPIGAPEIGFSPTASTVVGFLEFSCDSLSASDGMRAMHFTHSQFSSCAEVRSGTITTSA